MNRPNKAVTFLFFLFAIVLLLAIPFAGNSFSQQTTAHAQTEEAQQTLTYHGSAQASGVFSGRGVTVHLPGNIQPNDLLIAVAGTNGPVSSWTTPSGWIQGKNSSTSSAQGLTWWWKVADGSEADMPLVFQSNAYADGGIVVNVYQGQAADPIVGVSSLSTSDNFGNGHVTSADVAGVSLSSTVTAVPLLFASWQPYNGTITWPDGFIFESTATDGYSYVAVAERLSALVSDSFPGYNLTLSPSQAAVQTLQILIRVK